MSKAVRVQGEKKKRLTSIPVGGRGTFGYAKLDLSKGRSKRTRTRMKKWA